MDFRHGSTADIVSAVESWLVSLGLTNVSSQERWEEDEVIQVSWQGPGIGPDGEGPYFEVSGSDNPDCEPGVTLTIIRPQGSSQDDQIVVETPEAARDIFLREGYLPS